MTGPDAYETFVVGCGWGAARFERWLLATLERLLFRARSGDAASEGETIGPGATGTQIPKPKFARRSFLILCPRSPRRYAWPLVRSSASLQPGAANACARANGPSFHFNQRGFVVSTFSCPF